jgi:hypothetical protein
MFSSVKGIEIVDDLPPDHPLRVFAKCMLDSPAFPFQMRSYYERIVYSESTKRRRNLKEMNASDLDDFLSNANMRFLLLKCDPTLQHVRLGDIGVGALAGVFPWARSVLEQCQYVELDATFKALNPYVLCVPMAIIANESFPLGFVMGPTERAGRG